MREKPTIPMTCPACGTAFLAIKSDVKRDLRCCSTACGYVMIRRRTDAVVDARVVKSDDPNGCWDYTGQVHRAGYGFLHRRGEESLMHRRAWVQATGETLTKNDVIAHTCDRRICCRNDDVGTYEVDGVVYPRRGHLFKATRPANSADMVAKRRNRIGSSHPAAKLTEVQVQDIRRLAAHGVLQRQIAADFGVGQVTVSRIVARKTWAHI